MWKQFKEFAFKGNIFDMAIGVVVGGAFGKIVTSLVNDIIMPVFSAVLGGINFSDWKWVLKAATDTTEAITVNYGASTSFVWTVTDLLCSVPTCLNIICVLLMSGTYFKIVRDYKARYMGIGKIDPSFQYFYEKDQYERAEAARKTAAK